MIGKLSSSLPNWHMFHMHDNNSYVSYLLYTLYNFYSEICKVELLDNELIIGRKKV